MILVWKVIYEEGKSLNAFAECLWMTLVEAISLLVEVLRRKNYSA